MSKLRIWILLVGIMTLMLAFAPAAAQGEVTIHHPVDGLFLQGTKIIQPDGRGREIGIVDTEAGSWSVIQISLLSLESRLFWSPNGQEIAFRFVGKYAGVVNPFDHSITFTTESIAGELNPPFDLTNMYGWSADGQSLAIATAQISQPSSLVTLFDVHVTSHTVQQIRQWRTDDQVTDMPLPPGTSNVRLTGAARIERTPVFDDWFLMQLDGVGYDSTLHVEEPGEVGINVLWNFRTNEYISLDALVPDLRIVRDTGDWSRDGKHLIFHAFSKNMRNIYIVVFHFTPDQGASLMGQAVVDNRTIQYWLDAGGLFFSRVHGYEGGAAYVLGEIVNGEYRETPFFTLNGEQFDRESLGDWYLEADEAEQHALSCLFEWSLPERFGVGDRARVNFSDGMPLRLRDAPDLAAAQVTQMPEGTAFEVIGGPACVNTGDDHYRFWQIALDDGTTGWAAEANMSDYFIEPVPDLITPTADAGAD